MFLDKISDSLNCQTFGRGSEQLNWLTFSAPLISSVPGWLTSLSQSLLMTETSLLAESPITLDDPDREDFFSDRPKKEDAKAEAAEVEEGASASLEPSTWNLKYIHVTKAMSKIINNL